MPASPLPLWKRSTDLAFCLLALPGLAIATFLVAALMSITSPGPIFFRQERVGHMGRRFRLYKFRTMHVGVDTSKHQAYFTNLMNTNAPMQKLDAKGDPRLIPMGWLLRASGLDELPQIINVWKGEMSVIGPRPCIPYEYENYSDAQRARFHAQPGLTGLWQVSGKNRTSFDRMIQLDIQYATERSLLMDAKILLLTFPAVLSQIYDMCRVRWSGGGPQPDQRPVQGDSKPPDIEKNAPPVRAA
jgi:lipopolysaccharide/colanic/teichoic acid biosynthesis glycosyltransferase